MARDRRDSKAEELDEMEDGELVIRKRQQVVRKNVTREDVIKAVSTMITVMHDKQHPAVQTYSDAASAPFVAACTFAAGARPLIIEDTGDASQISAFATGLSASLGGLSKPRQEAVRAAVGQAVAGARPWVLCAEGVDMLSSRRFFAKEIARRLPGIIIGTPAEIVALEGTGESAGADVEKEAVAAAARIAAESHSTVVVSTPFKDTVVCEDRPTLEIGMKSAGVPVDRVPGWMAAKAALAASYLALLRNHKYAAAASASLVGAVAADMAFTAPASQPGSFAKAYVDALSAITPEDLSRLAQFEVLGC